MSKEERYAEHTVAWELPNGDSVTKSNYNLAGIETKYIPIQTEVISADKDKQIADLQSQLAEKEKEIEYQESMKILAVKNQNQKAIEQLAEVKEWCIKYLSYCAYRDNSYDNIFELLDCKISELKGKVEDVIN